MRQVVSQAFKQFVAFTGVYSFSHISDIAFADVIAEEDDDDEEEEDGAEEGEDEEEEQEQEEEEEEEDEDDDDDDKKEDARPTTESSSSSGSGSDSESSESSDERHFSRKQALYSCYDGGISVSPAPTESPRNGRVQQMWTAKIEQ